MATRVNTKVVWGIIIGVVLAVGAVGALWFLQASKDPTRYARAAEQLALEGDYENAWRQYAVALRHDPANLEYLEKAEDALTSYVPESALEAAEYYNQFYIPLLNQKARYYPNDLEANLRMLREITIRAKVIGTPEAWQVAEDGANTIVNRLLDDNIVRAHAEVYLWHLRLRNSLRMSVDELSKAYSATQELAAALPNDDLAQYTMVWAGLLLAEQYQRTNQPAAATDQFERSRAELESAMAAVPDGPDVARLHLMVLAMDRRSQMSAGEDVSVTEDDIAGAAASALQLALDSDDTRVMSDAVDVVLQVGGAAGARLVADTLRQFVDRHPDDLPMMYATARLFVEMKQFEEAEEFTSRIVGLERGGVGLNSWFYDTIQRSTLALDAEIAFNVWEAATDDDARAAATGRLEAIRDQLATRYASVTADPARYQVDGMVDFVQQNYVKAAQNFEEAINTSRAPSDTLLLLSSAALERVNQVGLALDRFQRVVARHPGNVSLLVRLAQLQLTVRHTDDARDTIERIRAIEPDHGDLNQLERVATAQAAAFQGAVDPIAQAIINVQRALDDDDLETGRSILETIIAEAPNDTRGYEALVRLESTYGTMDAARDVVQRGLDALPENTRLKQIQALLDTNDPIERIEAMTNVATDDPLARSVQTVRALRAMNKRYVSQINLLERRSDAERLAEVRDLADRSQARIDALVAELEQVDPESQDVLGFLLDQAVAAEDWDRAEQLLERAQRQNLDQANGLLVRGQYELMRGRPEEAVRLLTDATAQFDFSAAAWRMLAGAYEQIGNTTEAIGAYEESYRRNPVELATIRPFVALLERVGEFGRARAVMNDARRVAPRDASIRETWLRMETQAGNLSGVLAVRQRVYASNPYDRTNALALASFYGQQTPSRQLILDAEGNAQFSEQAWRRMPASVREQTLEAVQSDWDERWDRILSKVAERPGDAFMPLLVRAELMRRRNRGDEAEQMLLAHIDAQSEPADRLRLLLRLGRYQMSVAQYSRAAKTLASAQEYQDETTREADRALADLYTARGAPSGAAALLRPLWESGRDPEVGAFLLEAELSRGELDAAETLLDDLSSIDGVEQAYVVYNRARIMGERVNAAFAAGDEASGNSLERQYRQMLDQYAADMPNDARPIVMLARSQYTEYRRNLGAPNDSILDDAMLTLQRADRVQSGLPDVYAIRAAILIERNDRRAAATELRQAVELSPDNETLRAQYIELLAGFDAQAAIAAAVDGINRDPGSARWPEMLGDLQVQLDPTSATDAYEQALAIRPTPVLVSKWAQVRLNLEPPAYQTVLERLDASAFDLDTNPGLRCLRAIALDGVDRNDEAASELRTAFQTFEQFRLAGDQSVRLDAWFAALNQIYGVDRAAELEAFVRETAGRDLTGHELRLLAQIWFAVGEDGYSRSIELQEQSIDLHGEVSDDVRMAMLGELGTYYLMARRYPESLIAFEGMLEIEPDQPQALNNAAYVLSEFLDDQNPALAVQYAEHANRVTPGDPNVLDTLGWAYYKAGRLEDARRELQESVKTLRSSAAYYHLAVVQAEMGDKDAALRSLVQASDLGPDNVTQAKIEALTVEIHSGDASGGAE